MYLNSVSQRFVVILSTDFVVMGRCTVMLFVYLFRVVHCFSVFWAAFLFIFSLDCTIALSIFLPRSIKVV